jgi:hypothetical protein
MVGESFAYAKDAVVGKWMQWLLLVIATVLLCIPLMGYIVRVLRGEKPAPEVTDWVGLIVDGIKYLIISLIYAIPALIILVVTLGTAILALVSGDTSLLLASLGGMVLGILLLIIVAVICGLFGTIGLIRFARSGSLGEAFNFPEIKETIGKIGWVSYIVALVIMLVIQVIIAIIFAVITLVPILGFIIEFILIAPVALFEARYLALVYDTAGTA